MKFILMAYVILSSSIAFSQDYIVEKVVPEKGYILSIDLSEKECKKIWNEQINLFMENNEHVKNPDLILIGQEINVQNCKKVIEEKIAVKNEDKKDDNSFEFFVIASYLNQYTEKKDNDQKKKSEGYKLEIGKYFDIGEDKLKLSLGIVKINSIYYNQDFGLDDKRENGFVTFDSSYLIKLSNPKFEVGPHFGIVYQPYDESSAMKDYDNKDKDTRISPTIGGNLVYSLNEDWKIDLKMSNRIETRINLWSSLGIEYNF